MQITHTPSKVKVALLAGGNSGSHSLRVMELSKRLSKQGIMLIVLTQLLVMTL
jgi:aryl carrier-like protein